MAATGKANVQPLPLRIRPTRRLAQLYLGLIGYTVSMALMIESGLGNQPWDVLHQGLSVTTGLSVGTVIIVTGMIVLALWIPLRQRPGLGTISNVVVIGLSTDLALALLPTPIGLVWRTTYLVAAVLLCALASGLYLGARFGPGPRDGLMTGFAARGYSLRLVRTGIEVSVVTIGFVLGGTVGIGTLLYALAIGPLVQLVLPWFTIPTPVPAPIRPTPVPA